MLISKAIVCTNPQKGTINGLQMTLTDTKTAVSTRLNAIGVSDDIGTICYNFLIDIQTDFLRYIRIIYDDTGIHGLELQTNTNRLAKFGTTDVTNLNLKKVGIGLKVDEGLSFAIVGFKGTQQQSATIAG
jgi:hypothetical protein